VNKFVGAGRANGLFVEALSIELAALQACDFGAHQRDAVLKILRAIRRPDLELLVVRDQSLDMLPSMAGHCGLTGCRFSECSVELILCGFEH
jgi:hypothetical protein